MKNNKKAQLQQVFIYIITIIIVGLIFVVGYKAIGGIMEKGCDVEVTNFKSNLKSYITKYNTYGSVQNENMKSPCDYSHICFVDTGRIQDSDPNNKVYAPEIVGNNQSKIIIGGSANAGIEENVFLIKSQVTDPFGFYDEIEVAPPDYVVCFNSTRNGFFNITFEGTGRTTLIS